MIAPLNLNPQEAGFIFSAAPAVFDILPGRMLRSFWMKMRSSRFDIGLFIGVMTRRAFLMILAVAAVFGLLLPSSFSFLVLPFSVQAVSPSDGPSFVSILAGSGHLGLQDGASRSARFNWPTGTVSDQYGNRFIADSGNHVIRQINRFGIVTTYAGRGSAGFSDGIGRGAMFNGPNGLALDRTGNLFVADSGNLRIRKIAPGGEVTTVAGSGRKGNNEGPAAEAEFVDPVGVAVDRSGALYVADRGAHRIKRVTPFGIVMIAAGTGEAGTKDGTGVLAQFHDPSGITVDAFDHVYVADAGSHTIRRIDQEGVVTTVAGSGAPGDHDGLREQAGFFAPTGVALDLEGNLFVADSKNHRIRKIKLPEGRVMTIAGTGRQGDLNGDAGSAGFHHPTGIEVDPFGQVYIADSANHQIRWLTVGPLQVDFPFRPHELESLFIDWK